MQDPPTSPCSEKPVTSIPQKHTCPQPLTAQKPSGDAYFVRDVRAVFLQRAKLEERKC